MEATSVASMASSTSRSRTFHPSRLFQLHQLRLLSGLRTFQCRLSPPFQLRQQWRFLRCRHMLCHPHLPRLRRRLFQEHQWRLHRQ